MMTVNQLIEELERLKANGEGETEARIVYWDLMSSDPGYYTRPVESLAVRLPKRTDRGVVLTKRIVEIV